MYVSDSLFFLQHLVGGDSNDEYKRMFALRFTDIMNREHADDDDQSPDEIIERMKNKARAMK